MRWEKSKVQIRFRFGPGNPTDQRSPIRRSLCELACSTMALGALLALSLISCGPATTLFLQGGQRQLKANMHPTSQSLRTSEGPRMIIFAFDGVGYDQFMATVHSGKAP